MSLTPEQIAEIKKITGEAIGAALAGPDFKAVIGAALTPAIEGATKPLADKLAAFEAAAKKPETPPKKDEEGGKGIPAELQQKIAAMEAQLKDAEAKRAAAERSALEDRAYGSVREALAKSGVPADRIQLAMAFVKSEGLVKFGDDGSFGFEKVDQWGNKAKIDPAAWAGEFVKTDTGKALLPAAPMKGAGSEGRPSSAPVTSNGAVDWDAIARSPMATDVFSLTD